MAIISLSIGTVPGDEPGAQAGITADWLALQQLEATTYRAALIAVHGPRPDGVGMPIKIHDHDFGPYAELEVQFDATDPAAAAYAAGVEDGLASWIDAGFTAPVVYDGPQPGLCRLTAPGERLRRRRARRCPSSRRRRLRHRARDPDNCQPERSVPQLRQNRRRPACVARGRGDWQY